MSKFYFPNDAAEFVYTRTYSKWTEEKGRRENWDETVDRYMQFLEEERGELIPKKVKRKIRQYILEFKVMPSMRALWSAGPAAKAENVCMYNCAFSAVDNVGAFSDCLYILMCGTGYGFSVEKKYVSKLPVVEKLTTEVVGTFTIPDDKAGWADSLKILIKGLYEGKDTHMIYDLIRKEGSRLKNMGGRASGPAPLITLHNFVREIFAAAQGRQLTPLEVHDIMNQIAEIVIVGGVRRSSEISFSDLDDDEMANAKVGNFPLRRYMSNNSAVYYEKPSSAAFLKEWNILANSGSGERGISNLGNARKNAPKRRDGSLLAGHNPCHEIVLRSKQFCNLSEIVVRAEDDLDDLLQKVEGATWLGAIQSTFTNFPYLDSKWKFNCDEEKLLGISITGQMDNPELMNKETFKALKKKALKIAKKAAKELGINFSAAVTTVKPSGTVSQLVDSASGLHTRFSDFYIRRYRIAASDPLFKMMKSQGIIMSPENGEGKNDEQSPKPWNESNVRTWIASFPVKSPENSIKRKDTDAIAQLEYYKLVQSNWCEHNASCTIYVKDDEWLKVGNWVFNNWEHVGGISFLPYDGGVYKQAPYEEISEEKYNKLVAKFKKIDYSKLSDFEISDNTSGAKSLACSGDSCELK